MRGPLSGNQAPHQLSLLLFGLTLQGGCTTYPASPQGNTQLCRKRIHSTQCCTIAHGFTTVTMYNLRKRCSKANSRLATRKEHKTTRALGSEKCKQVFLQVSSDSNNFLQSYTIGRQPKYCTKYYGAADRNNPAAQNSIEQGRLDTTIPKQKKSLLRATLSVCPPFRLVTNGSSALRNHLSRSGGAWFFFARLDPQLSCRLSGRA